MGNDRPGGMDSKKMNWPTPTQKSKPVQGEMGTVAKVAGGSVDSGPHMGKSSSPKMKMGSEE